MKLAYCAKVSLIDHYVGEIINALEENGLRDNTWIIYTSDHGDMLSDRRLLQKMVFFEEAVNVPCIICPPGGVQGWKSDASIDHLDITATMLEIAGAQQLAGSEGRSLLSQILGGPEGVNANEGKEVVFSEVYGFSMVRNDRYKMAIDDASQRAVEFYDLLEDPEEVRNLVYDSSIASIKNELFDRHIVRLLENQDKGKLNRYLKASGRL
jgi:arylsulfatase